MRKLLRLLPAACLSSLLFSQEPAAPQFRLDDTVRPLRYAVDLTVVPERETFSGTIAIDLEVRQSTPVIWMHGVDLDIREATVTQGRSVPAHPTPAENEILGFRLGAPLKPGRARLQAVYQGKIARNRTNGVFAVKDGPDWYAYTQFEAVDARRAFPCFDEPRFKTPWQVTLHVRKEHLALSNTPAVSETDGGDGMKTVKFAETRPLPSYLVAFAAGPFEAVDAGRAGIKKTPLRVITPRGKTAQARYARGAIPPLLALLEEYFGIAYPYEKLDSIAVPVFPGAMENPGLITYGQTLLLARPGEEPIALKRLLASIAAHEMAHQWFGDLVTMNWWDDTWLNEAFASWMAGKIVGRWKPEWNAETGAASTTQSVMGLDSLVAARRIRQPVESKDDIANAFDGITYDKGAAVIGMFERWVGVEVFRSGVRQYLTKHAWGNAAADDFLGAVSGAARRDIAPAFSSFLHQAGVPLVSVELDCGRQGPPKLVLAQKRFLPLGSKGAPDQTWRIPVCVKFSGGRECTLLSQPAAEFPLASAQACPEWVEANENEAGYYRVLYRGGLLDSLARNANALTAAERIGLLGDAGALINSGDLGAAKALALVPRFSRDASREVVERTAAIATGIEPLVPEELRPNYARFICAAYGERARELGWRAKPDEPEETRLLRSSLVPLAAIKCGDRGLIEEARALAARWLEDRGAVEPNMVQAVLSTAAYFGDAGLFNRLRAAAKQTQDRREREQLLAAMGSFADPDAARSALQLLLSDDFDPREAVFPVLFARARDPRTAGLRFEFVKRNYDALAARLPGGLVGDLTAFLPRVASSFCDEQHGREVEDFFKDRAARATGGSRILAQTLEQIRNCGAARAAQQGSVAAFLKGY